MSRFTSDLLFFIIVLLIAAILAFLTGYFWKRKNKSDDAQHLLKIKQLEEEKQLLASELKQAEAKHQQLNREYEAQTKAQEEAANLQPEMERLKAALQECENKCAELAKLSKKEEIVLSSAVNPVLEPKGDESHTLVFDAQAAKNVLGKKIVENDLKIIEGIGPKIEELLKSQNIATWQELAHSSPEAIKKLLVDLGGGKFSMHDPGSWPMQARLAFEGKWKELKDLQDRLSGGKEV